MAQLILHGGMTGRRIEVLLFVQDPIGRFEEGKQNIYTLRKNNNPDYHNINPTPLAQFSYDKVELANTILLHISDTDRED